MCQPIAKAEVTRDLTGLTDRVTKSDTHGATSLRRENAELKARISKLEGEQSVQTTKLRSTAELNQRFEALKAQLQKPSTFAKAATVSKSSALECTKMLSQYPTQNTGVDFSKAFR